MDGPHNPLVHLELHTADLGAARALLAQLCGWQSHDVEVGAGTYTTLGVGSAVGGGAVESGLPRPLWLPYVQVPDIDSATARASELGARVVLGPREGPVGWRSLITSAVGGELALWQPKR